MTITTTHDLRNPEPRLVTHDVERHAAHSLTGPGGHDLARWVVRHPSQPSREQLRALGVPDGAEYHVGYVHLGAQRWVYVERRPMSTGSRERCGAAASERLFAHRGVVVRAEDLTDDMIRDLRDEATYPGEIYAKCQRALGEHGEPCGEARASLAAFCRSLAGYLADHGDADLSRERKRFARLLNEWKANR